MIKIGYFGDGLWARLAFEKILSAGNMSVAFVVVRFDAPDGELKKMAEAANIPCFAVKNVNADEFISTIKSFNVDVNVSLSFNQILKRNIINAAPKGFINCHAGALPFYRGRNILNWAIINGETQFGVTVHYVDEGIDTGDIILQRFYPIEKTDRYGDVLSKAQKVCAECLYDALILLDRNKVAAVKQESIHSIGFYCSGRVDGDEYIDWNWSSERIYNFVRGIAEPAPGARTFLNGIEYIVDRAELVDGAPNYIDKVGNVVGKNSNGIVVKTGDSTLLITRMLEAETKIDLDLSKVRIGRRFYSASLEKDLRGIDDMSDKPVIVIGAGGHAKVLLDMLIEQGVEVVGILDDKKFSDRANGGGVISPFDIPIIGGDDDIVNYDADSIELVNGVGSVGTSKIRCEIYKKFKAQGYHFRQVIHQHSILSSKVSLGEGVQIMAGAVINVGSRIGDNSVINTRAALDHDCRIGCHVHIAPGSVISGGVKIGDGTHIGTGSSIIQCINVGINSVIGAGSVVVKDIPDNVKAYGVPAHVIDFLIPNGKLKGGAQPKETPPNFC